MAVSYKKLWKLLIDKDMKKKDLCAAAGISHASMAKLGKNENVTTDVLVKICTALQCEEHRTAPKERFNIPTIRGWYFGQKIT